MPVSPLMLALSAITTMNATSHIVVVEHLGVARRATYTPSIRTTIKTVGQSLGPRPSTEQCRWRSEILVSRTLTSAQHGAGETKVLPVSKVIEGSAPGNCAMARQLVTRARLAAERKAHDYAVEVARADRDMLSAEIGAATN